MRQKCPGARSAEHFLIQPWPAGLAQVDRRRGDQQLSSRLLSRSASQSSRCQSVPAEGAVVMQPARTWLSFTEAGIWHTGHVHFPGDGRRAVVISDDESRWLLLLLDSNSVTAKHLNRYTKKNYDERR